MSYLGLVPSEYSSGACRRQGAIYRSGNTHARRMLVEAGWNSCFDAQIDRCLEVRQEGQAKAMQETLEGAIAPRVAGFVWDIARHTPIKP